MVANAFGPGKDQNKNHFDLKCQESLVHWTSRWVISCKIIEKSEMLELITTDSVVTSITDGHYHK